MSAPAASPTPAPTKERVRFGIRFSPWLPNVGIFVIDMTPDQWNTFQGAVGIISTILEAVSPSLAQNLVCELS